MLIICGILFINVFGFGLWKVQCGLLPIPVEICYRIVQTWTERVRLVGVPYSLCRAILSHLSSACAGTWLWMRDYELGPSFLEEGARGYFCTYISRSWQIEAHLESCQCALARLWQMMLRRQDWGGGKLLGSWVSNHAPSSSFMNNICSDHTSSCCLPVCPFICERRTLLA